MNATEKALFELRAGIARDPDSLEDAELDYLLASTADDSDDNLAAAADLLGLDLESLEERAAIMQFDGGLARAAANRLALTEQLRRVMPDVSDYLAKWFMHHAADVVNYGREAGLNRDQLLAELHEYFQRNDPSRVGEAAAILGRAV